MARCEAANLEGKRCGAHALVDTRPPRCFMHAEGKAAAEAKAKARSLGGNVRILAVDRWRTPMACEERNAEGGPCGMPALKGTSRCWKHSKDVADRRKEAESRGGKSHGSQAARRANPPRVPLRLETSADVTESLGMVANDLWLGKMDPRSGNALVQMLTVLLEARRGRERAAGGNGNG